MNVNEKIVECWLNTCKNIFTIPDIKYDNYHSSIDILGVDLFAKEILDIEVKFKSRIKIDESSRKQNGYAHFKKQLLSPQRNQIIKTLLPNNHFKIVKVFITTRRFLTIIKFDYWNKKFKSDKIRLLFFEDIIQELSSKVDKLTKSDDEILQTLRIYKQFGINDKKII